MPIRVEHDAGLGGLYVALANQLAGQVGLQRTRDRQEQRRAKQEERSFQREMLAEQKAAAGRQQMQESIGRAQERVFGYLGNLQQQEQEAERLRVQKEIAQQNRTFQLQRDRIREQRATLVAQQKFDMEMRKAGYEPQIDEEAVGTAKQRLTDLEAALSNNVMDPEHLQELIQQEKAKIQEIETNPQWVKKGVDYELKWNLERRTDDAGRVWVWSTKDNMWQKEADPIQPKAGAGEGKPPIDWTKISEVEKNLFERYTKQYDEQMKLLDDRFDLTEGADEEKAILAEKAELLKRKSELPDLVARESLNYIAQRAAYAGDRRAFEHAQGLLKQVEEEDAKREEEVKKAQAIIDSHNRAIKGAGELQKKLKGRAAEQLGRFNQQQPQRGATGEWGETAATETQAPTPSEDDANEKVRDPNWQQEIQQGMTPNEVMEFEHITNGTIGATTSNEVEIWMSKLDDLIRQSAKRQGKL